MNEQLAESEYSAQYFGFTPEMFYEQFCELILDEMASVVQQLIMPLSVMQNKDELLENTVKIHSIWSKRAEIILKELLPIIKQVFTIPKNVLLPCDSSKEKQYSKEDIKKLEGEIKDLKKLIEEEFRSMHKLQAEVDILEKLEPLQQTVDEGMEKLKAFGKAVKETRELEGMAQTFTDYKNLLEIDTDTDDNLRIHKNKFH